MENLIRNEFIAFFYMQKRSDFKNGETEDSIRMKADIEKHQCADPYFEISDIGGHIEIYTTANHGVGKFINPMRVNVMVSNYDKFLTSLPNEIQRGKKRCDAIIYTGTKKNFLLGEVKITGDNAAKTTANKQFLDTLEMLLSVPAIKQYIDTFPVRRCCRFLQKPAEAPDGITAPASFNKLNSLYQDGYHISHSGIEEFGFELFRYSHTQRCELA